VIPRRAVAHTLDALADAWQWTGEDVLVHGLPLFHVHGLVLGILGPLRRGGCVRHLGRFSTEGVARELNDGATMVFGVAHIVAYLSQFFTLMPGDVITTGTPPGVGMARNPRVFLKPGDELRLTVSGLGEQRVKIVAEA